MHSLDLVFFHAPSRYDFRQELQVFGPISDVIPSSSVFEMYPVGMTSMAQYLEERGYKVQIINLAYRMLKDQHYDVRKAIYKTRSRYFALDLHWLPHVQGSLEIASIIKEIHPKVPIIFGGLTASYYHEELITYPQVDYVLRGDSVEEPLFFLLKTLDEKGDRKRVPNLTYKEGVVIKENPLSHVPPDLNGISIPAYQYVIHSILKYRSIHNSIPYQEWLEYPTTMLLTSRGCTYNCVICGGSCYAYKKIVNRKTPAFRSPERLIEDIRLITSFSRSPIFVVHDLRQGGEEYTRRFFHLLAGERVKNPFVFELFDPAKEEYLELINNSVSNYNLQLSLESHLPRIRAYGGKFNCSNQEVEKTLDLALKHGCRKMDLFFMVGLPGQTFEDALGSVDYLKAILKERGRGKIWPFIAPLAPFLDPGSLAFEKPERYGYRKFYHTLEDHRRALLQPSWKYMLSYETQWMNRHQIVEATYRASLGMNELKMELGLLDEKTYARVKESIHDSMQIIDELESQKPSQREKYLLRLKDERGSLHRYSICGEKELRWTNRKGLKGYLTLFLLALRFFSHQLRFGVKLLSPVSKKRRGPGGYG